MSVTVMKFGGTSVASSESRRKVAERIKEASALGQGVVAVFSAMGRKGEPYATDSLINMANSVHENIPERELDLLMSCGEIISCVVMGQELRRYGVDSYVLTGPQAGIKTDGNYGDAKIVKIDVSKIRDLLSEGRVVVVAGFQGAAGDHELATLGRGGSDTTAAALGVALDAASIDIFTDVEGIMTADPRVCDDARMLTTITFGEICQMAHLGAKVIHPRAVEIAMQKSIPIRVRSTFSSSLGTLITDNGFSEDAGEIRNDRVVTGVTHLSGINQIKVYFSTDNAADIELRIFEVLAEAGISIDLINAYPDHAVFTIKDEKLSKTLEAFTRIGVDYEVREGCAKVSVVGAGMQGVPGVMVRVVAAMYKAGVRILQTADSNTTISVLVEEQDMKKTVSALHYAFDLTNQEG